MGEITIHHVSPKSSLYGLHKTWQQRIVAAQEDNFEACFKTASELWVHATGDLKIGIKPPSQLSDEPASFLGDMDSRDLNTYVATSLTAGRVPPQAVTSLAASLSHRVQLIRAFANPDDVIQSTCTKISKVVKDLPGSAAQIRCGKNRGDVLDPYMLAAAQILLCDNNFESTINATVAHKAMMKIEGLLGHMHEDVIGAMRGNVRLPEPKGENKYKFDPLRNPFPGAEILQPPNGVHGLKLFQIKSKTGSANSAGGKSAGLQLKELSDYHGCKSFYAALVGNTLVGHRSMAIIQRTGPDVVFLVTVP